MRSNRKWMTRMLASAAAAGLSWGGVAAAAEKVAVQAFQAKGVDQTVASIVESSFCSALSEEKVDAMCPDALAALMQSAQLNAGMGGTCGDEDAKCIEGLAKAADASRIATGQVSRLGDTFLLTVTLIDAGSKKVLVRATEKAGKAEDLLDKVKPLAKKVAAK